MHYTQSLPVPSRMWQAAQEAEVRTEWFLSASPCILLIFLCSGMDHPQAEVPLGVSLLWYGFSRSHSPSGVSLLWHGASPSKGASPAMSPAMSFSMCLLTYLLPFVCAALSKICLSRGATCSAMDVLAGSDRLRFLEHDGLFTSISGLPGSSCDWHGAAHWLLLHMAALQPPVTETLLVMVSTGLSPSSPWRHSQSDWSFQLWVCMFCKQRVVSTFHS